MKKGTLYLIPVSLHENWSPQMPNYIADVAKNIQYFIVEKAKTARRFIKLMQHPLKLEEIILFELNKHTEFKEIDEFLKPILEGHNIGLMTEAGCPAIADPGAVVVKKCHQLNIKVVPLVGPSSILLALMASGMNGQSFTFNGYLPVKQNERIDTLKRLEKTSKTFNQTQIMIETPYRNNAFFEDAVKHLSNTTLFCVATDLTLETEEIKTKNISEWRKTPFVDLNNRPTVFLIYA